MHDQLSDDIQRLAQTKLLTIFGQCPMKSYKTDWMAPGTVVVSVEVSDQHSVEYYLEFNHTVAANLDRICTNVIHPDGLFKLGNSPATVRAAFAADCAVNLFFGLVGESETVKPGYFTKFFSSLGKGTRDPVVTVLTKPTDYIHEMQHAELASGGVVTPLESIDSRIVQWAVERYPDLDIEDRQRAGLSIIDAISDVIWADSAEARIHATDKINGQCGEQSIHGLMDW